MAVLEILPETNLRDLDIRDTLNAFGGSVDTGVSAFLTSAKLNKWARYKPESYKKDFDLTEDERATNHYGLNLSSSASLFGSVGATLTDGNLSIYNDTNGFLYKLCKGILGQFDHILPSGTSSSPYRFGDFRGYNPSAVNPLPVVESRTYKYTEAGAVNINMTLATPSLNGLTLDLLSTDGNTILSGMYYGIILYNDDLTDIIFGTQTADQKSKGVNAVTLKNNDYVTITNKRGTYKAKTFFSNTVIGLNDYVNANPSILLGDDDTYSTVHLVPAYEDAVVLTKEYKTISSTKYRLIVNITNNTESAITVTSCKFLQSDSLAENDSNNVPLTIEAWGTSFVYYETGILEGDSFTATLTIDGETYTV